MIRLIGNETKGLYSKGIPARGCSLCYTGAKTVVFVTGECGDSCYYCPVNRNKLYHDVFYVNEEPVSSIEELVVEAQRSGAVGASITGGDPLTRLDRTIEVIRVLKDSMYDSFHIHLYTTGRYASLEVLKVLEKAGLDEIRFHPTLDQFLDRVKTAVERTSMDVGIEIPVAPRMETWVKNIILYADNIGAKFVNLNEMEFVEPNARALMVRGYMESSERPFTVKGSFDTAIRILEWARNNVSIPVHFCPASFKDSIQTKNRLRRTAVNDASWYETPTDTGTLLYYVEKCTGSDCKLYRIEAYPTRHRKPVVNENPVTSGDPTAYFDP